MNKKSLPMVSLSERTPLVRLFGPGFTAASLFLACSLSGNAATIDWTGTTNSTWATGTNWTGGTAPANSLSADIANFNLAGYPNQPDAGTTGIKGVTIGSSSSGLNLAGTALTIGSGGIVVSSGASASAISAPITLGAAQTWTNSSVNLLTVGAIARNTGTAVNFAPGTGGIQTSNTNTNGILGGWATLGNSGASGATADWATVDGSGNISAYTGYTDVASGNQDGSGASAQNWRTVNTGATTTLTASATVNSLVVRSDFAVSAGNTLTLGSGGLILSGISRWIKGPNGNTGDTGQLTSGLAGGELFVDVSSSTSDANNWRIWTKIVDNGGTAVSVVKNGPGFLELANANTYTGDTYLNSGTLAAGITNAFGTTGTLYLNGGTLTDDNAGANVDLPNNIVVSGSNAIQLGVAKNLGLNGGISGSGSLTLGNNNQNSSIYLSGANTMTGGTITLVNNTNSVRFASAAAGNANVAWVFNNTGSNRDTMDFASGGTISFGSMTGVGIFQGNGAGTRTVSVGALGLTDTFSGVIANGSGTTAVTKVGTGTWTLSGANTYTGGTTLAGGKVSLGSANAIGTTGNISFTGGALQFSAGNTTDYSARIATGTSTAAVSIDTNGQSVTFANALAQTNGLTKSGLGRLTLSAASAYSGATHVQAGTLAYANNFTLSGANQLTVAATGTAGTDYATVLGGSGNTLTYGGTLAINFSSSFLAGGENFSLFQANGGSLAGDFTGVSIAGSYLASLTNSSGVWTGTTGGLDFTFTESTGVLNVALAAVPEPSAYAALFGVLILGGALLLRQRRRY